MVASNQGAGATEADAQVQGIVVIPALPARPARMLEHPLRLDMIRGPASGSPDFRSCIPLELVGGTKFKPGRIQGRHLGGFAIDTAEFSLLEQKLDRELLVDPVVHAKTQSKFIAGH